MKEKIILFCALITQVFGYSQVPADVDPSFFLPSGTITSAAKINSIAIQSDGKIVIGGQFDLINGTSKVNIARLNINGNLDTTFLSTANNYGTSPGTVNSVGILNSGEIIIGGKFQSVNVGALRNYFAAFNNDGTVSMNVYQNGLNNEVYCVATSNNSYAYGGLFTRYYNDIYINNPLNGSVKVIAYQSDGKTLIGGDFTTCGTTTTNGFTRLVSGHLDTTFNQAGIGVGGKVSAIALQPDGKIIIAGSFSQYGGVARKGIARLNSNGTLDTTFTPPATVVFGGNNPGFRAIAIQSNGKIIIGGGISSFNGITRNGITRLNADGSLDTSFDPGAGFAYVTVGNADVKTISLQTDGKIIVGGSFTSYKGTTCNGIVRLIGDSVLSLDNQYLKDFNIYPNPAKDKFTIVFGNELISNYTIKINNMLGQEVYSNVIDKPQFEVSKTWQGEGIYFVKILNAQNEVVNIKKIILQ